MFEPLQRPQSATKMVPFGMKAKAATERSSVTKVVDNRFSTQQAMQLKRSAETYSKFNESGRPANSNAQGLPNGLKLGIEQMSGYTMDDVRVHFNSSQPAQLRAHAYAQGNDIHLAPGQERHLPHEAWHVVQQKQGRVRPTIRLNDQLGINDDRGLESEADIMGRKAKSFKGDEAQRPRGKKDPQGSTFQLMLRRGGRLFRRGMEGMNQNNPLRLGLGAMAHHQQAPAPVVPNVQQPGPAAMAAAAAAAAAVPAAHHQIPAAAVAAAAAAHQDQGLMPDGFDAPNEVPLHFTDPVLPRVFVGFGIEGSLAMRQTAVEGDVVLYDTETFWEGVDPDHLTGQTWSDIGGYLQLAGFNESLMWGSEGQTIESYISSFPDRYVPAKVYQMILTKIRHELESRGVLFMKGAFLGVTSDTGLKEILTDGGELLYAENVEVNSGPGKERGAAARERMNLLDDNPIFSTGADAIQQPFLPQGEIVVKEGGPTSAWVIEEMLLNLGYDKNGWTWKGEGWDEKPEFRIKWLIDFDFGNLDTIRNMGRTTPRLKPLIDAILEDRLPVDIIMGQIDIGNLPQQGGDLQYTEEDGSKSAISNVSAVISSAGQEGRQLYEKYSDEYWLASRAMYGRWQGNGENDFTVIRGIRGHDGVEIGFSSSLAICQYAMNSKTVSKENQAMARIMVKRMVADWTKIKAIMGSQENPLGGIANILAVRSTKPV